MCIYSTWPQIFILLEKIQKKIRKSNFSKAIKNSGEWQRKFVLATLPCNKITWSSGRISAALMAYQFAAGFFMRMIVCWTVFVFYFLLVNEKLFVCQDRHRLSFTKAPCSSEMHSALRIQKITVQTSVNRQMSTRENKKKPPTNSFRPSWIEGEKYSKQKLKPKPKPNN